MTFHQTLKKQLLLYPDKIYKRTKLVCGGLQLFFMWLNVIILGEVNFKSRRSAITLSSIHNLQGDLRGSQLVL